MTITDAPRREHTLDEAMLEGFRERAAGYDRENRFFTEDLDDLREAGYLLAVIPEEYGGWGLDLEEVSREQRRLARYAPATALATSMHLYWTGQAAALVRLGYTHLEWILRDAADGHVFASGHGEAGNDISLAFSTTTAERVEGGWILRGRKNFGSLSPVWTRLGVHAMDATAPEGPIVIHGYLDRDTPGLEIVQTWDTLGMRATQSNDTVLDGVFLPDHRVGAIVPVGGEDPYVGVMSMWALTLFSNVYTGIAERAMELAVHSAKTKSSIAIPRGAYAYNPFVQHQVAEMYLELEAGRACVDRLASDWVSGVDHGDQWAAKIFATKWRAVEAAKRVVDIALDVAGGGAIFRRNELERLYRDVRAGGFHPGNDALTHEMVGKIALGIVAEQPRF